MIKNMNKELKELKITNEIMDKILSEAYINIPKERYGGFYNEIRNIVKNGLK